MIRKSQPTRYWGCAYLCRKKEVGPASAGLEHFIVLEQLICKAEDCLLFLSEQFSRLDFANAYGYTPHI